MSIDADLGAAIALTRFGLGAAVGEIDRARPDPAAYLMAQIRREGADQPQGPLRSVREAVLEAGELRLARRDARAEGQPQAVPKMAVPKMADPVLAARAVLKDTAGDEFLARARLAATTDAGFRERWALFWCNHFTVAANKLFTAVLAGPFEREAIRPNVFGRFEDLLAASTRHPGMLYYLDQAQSVGPDSPAARRRGQGGLNENLAREILELHTLGVGSGYTQADVTEFARALTGWSFVGPDGRAPAGAPDAEPGDFAFRPFTHQPGARRILGRTYAQAGEAQARAVLHDLATHPATARHIAVKLARHFVADDPPPTLVSRLERSFSAGGGRLDRLAEALIDAPEAWAPAAAKVKTPYEFLTSSYRALGAEPTALPQIVPVLTSLGQKPFSAPSPRGWPEEAQAWAAPDAVVKRMAWAESFSAAWAPLAGQPVEIARSALGARLGPRTAQAIARAESRPEALSILLMSPEFQRR